MRPLAERLAELAGLPEIRTGRLSLVPWRAEDAPALHAVLQRDHDHLRPWIPFMRSPPKTAEATERFLTACIEQHESGVALHFRVVVADTGAFAGEVMLIARDDGCELGYWLASDQTGHGYATEASRGLVTTAFETLGLEAVFMSCEAENVASNQVARRLGAYPAERLTVAAVLDDRPVTLVRWLLEAR
ncbi:MAG: GNAT family N-acetyltransferase [Myxococcota bacterium]